jgi:WD40 repeat protein
VFAGSLAIVGQGAVDAIDTKTGSHTMALSPALTPKGPDALAVAPDASLVAFAAGGHITVVTVPAGEKRKELDADGDVVFLGFLGGGSLLSCGGRRCTRWNLETGARTLELVGHDSAILDASLSTDRKRLVTASADRTARVWDLDSGSPITVLRGHGGDVLHALLSREASTVVTASADSTAKVWNVSDGRLLASLEGHVSPVFALALAPDDIRIATGDSTGTAFVWDARSGKLIEQFQLGEDTWVAGLAFSPDGAALAGALADGTISVEDVHPETRDPVEVRKLVEGRELSWALDAGKLMRVKRGEGQ